MSNKTRLQIFVPEEDAKLIKQSAIEEGRTLSDHIIATAERFNFQLSDHISCTISRIDQVKEGSEFWRIDIDFYETLKGLKVIADSYELWASEKFIENFLGLPRSPNKPNKKDIAQFAYQFIAQRYKKTGNKIPREYGAFCSNKIGIKIVNASGTLVSHFLELQET